MEVMEVVCLEGWEASGLAYPYSVVDVTTL